MWSGSSFREVFQYMLQTWHKHHKFWVWTKLNRNTVSALTTTLSTHSIFKCSGIVVIHAPFVRRRNIPCSAANHMSYSPKFCQRSMSRSGYSKAGKENKAKLYKLHHLRRFCRSHWVQQLLYLDHCKAPSRVLLDLDAL